MHRHWFYFHPHNSHWLKVLLWKLSWYFLFFSLQPNYLGFFCFIPKWLIKRFSFTPRRQQHELVRSSHWEEGGGSDPFNHDILSHLTQGELFSFCFFPPPPSGWRDAWQQAERKWRRKTHHTSKNRSSVGGWGRWGRSWGRRMKKVSLHQNTPGFLGFKRSPNTLR